MRVIATINLSARGVHASTHALKKQPRRTLGLGPAATHQELVIRRRLLLKPFEGLLHRLLIAAALLHSAHEMRPRPERLCGKLKQQALW